MARPLPPRKVPRKRGTSNRKAQSSQRVANQPSGEGEHLLAFDNTAGFVAGVALANTSSQGGSVGVSVLPPLGFNNTFAILIRRSDATRLARHA